MYHIPSPRNADILSSDAVLLSGVVEVPLVSIEWVCKGHRSLRHMFLEHLRGRERERGRGEREGRKE